MVWEDLTPRKIMTRKAFENAVFVAAAAGCSTNCPPHVIAIARHLGVELDIKDWELGRDIPLLVNMQPAGEYLGEEFFRAGGVPAVIKELIKAGRFHSDAMTCTGKTMGENHEKIPFSSDRRVVKPYDQPMMPEAGFCIMSGNIFDSAVMKTSVVTPEFKAKYLEDPEHPACSRAAPSSSRAPRTITTASTAPSSTSTRTASCSSAIAARSAIRGRPRWSTCGRRRR